MDQKPFKKNLVKYLLLGVIFIVFLIPTWFYLELKRSKPLYEGELALKGISRSVEILRDKSGIPHIYAENDLDAYYALGFTMAEERLFQMEISRRAAKGQLSELVGEKTLQSDKTFKNLKIEKSVQEMLEYQKLDQKRPDLWAKIQAFYQGVNDYQFNNPLPIEFKILNIKPRAFDVSDAYSFIGLMSFNFAVSLMQDPLLTNLEKKLGTELVDDMRVEKINTPRKIVSKTVMPYQNRLPEVISFLEHGFPLYDGSNGWLLGKKRTYNNQNMLVNDPHISFPHPGIWYEAHIKTPNFETYGHFLPLIPFPILFHNQEKSWGLTMTLTDDMDLYQEKIIDDKFYLYNDQKLPLKVTPEKILIKGKPDYEFLLKETKHGPVLNEIISNKDVALSWAFLSKENEPLSVLYDMSMSKNMQEFKTAVSRGIAPGLNVLYADKENIAWWMFGKVVKKPDHIRSDFILDGTNSKDEPVGEMSFEEKPHQENPESGIIVSANFRPFGFPANQRGDWQPDDRFNTIYTLLTKKEKWSIEETKELQTLSLNLDNKAMLTELLFDLKHHPINQEYIEEISKWDFVSDKDSKAALIFYTFQNLVAKKLLSDLSADEFETFAKISTSYNFLKRVILDRTSPWWKKYDRQKLVNEAFDQTIAILQNKFGKNSENWSWGKAHTLEYVHPIGKIWPLNYIFNLGPYPISGASQDINNQKSDSLKDTFLVKAGPSTRRIINMGEVEKAQGILPIGESGHLLSPFYKNQVEDYLNAKYRPMYINRNDIEQNLSYRLKLIPLSKQ